jgi:phosphatidylinositol-3-phosphatase
VSAATCPPRSVSRPRFRRSRPRLGLGALALASAVALGAPGAVTAFGAAPVRSAPAAAGLPRPDHVVVVIEENHGYSQIIGSPSAPYINSLAAAGASFTQSFAVTHPSEPNYLALFSGSTQGVTDDSCPNNFSAVNLGSELIGAGLGFKGYSESMPSNGYTGCDTGTYARKHNPWVMFSNVPASDNLTFASFPTDFTTLPPVSFVVPNLDDDMHDGTIAQGDSWLKGHLDSYAQWAKTHNSELILTWDEDEDGGGNNQIATVMVGASVKTGRYSEHVNHYNVLRTLEDFYGLPHAGASASATPITDAFTTGTQNSVTVTDPGAQTGTVGGAVSLQIAATDSAAGQTLTYSATGLPAGLAISPSTGLITGTPTTAGTSTVSVTATDTTGAAGTATFAWTVNPTGGGGSAIVNGGFETGDFTAWTRSGTTAVVSSPTHSGTHAARLGSTAPTNGDSKLSQTFTAPTGSTHVSFWYDVTCPDDVTYDWATAKLKDDTTGVTTTVLPKTCTLGAGWKQVTKPITPGHSYTLTLTSHDENNPGDATYTTYDDVTVG